MAQAFVLGNGVSRQGLDLYSLQIHGKIYGCNALYRDFEPDVLISTDRAIADHIQHSGYALTRTFYTRTPLEGLGARRIPEQWWKFSSGQVAVALAADTGCKTVWMLGFDLGPDSTNKFNNVYAGSEFYKSVGSVPTYTRNWVIQTVEICRHFGNTQFVRVTGATTAKISEFESVSNLSTMNQQQFLQQVNNG